MGDLLHMFGVIEGSGGDNDEPAACCMNHKVRQETVERPYGDLMEGGEEGCANSVIPRMQKYYEYPRDVTLPIEKYYYHLYPRNKLLLGDFSAVTGDCDSQHAVQGAHLHSCILLLALSLSFRWSCPAP